MSLPQEVIFMKKIYSNKLWLCLSALAVLSLGACSFDEISSVSHVSSEEISIDGSSSTSFEDDSVHVTGVYLNYDSMTLRLGKTKKLMATIEPSDATNQNLSWRSSDDSIASVANGVVTGEAVGTATITVKTSDGEFEASCEVTVSDSDDDTYVPDDEDTDIYLITEETLVNGEYDSDKDEYTFTVTGEYKQIYVNVPEKTVIVELNGATIQNTENSPIYVLDCDSIEISAKKKTTNNVIDSRPIYTEEDSSQGKGAIYVANGDLKLKGTGTLNVSSSYYNGIHGKDDVKIQKQTLNITAVNHGVKGNDSIEIASGTINISCGGDGLKTENTDISSKGKQRGNVTINGGKVTINSWCDAISAAYNAEFEELDDETIEFTANTNTNSSYDGEIVEKSESAFYLKMNSYTYANGNYTYAAYIGGEWYPASYKGTQSSQQGGGPGGPGGPGGGGSTYYIYEIAKPSDAASFVLYRFQGSNVTSFSTDSYNAKSDTKTFNANYDMIQISISSGKINFGNWSSYSSNGVSSKGIKAENEVNIVSGGMIIKSVDDGIHTNSDASLENNTTPIGDVNISGGNISIETSDDGIHADCGLNISGGYINVQKSYEGLEGNTIDVSGGEIYVYASDDGMNASSGKVTPSITISGGFMDIEVPASGDTDGMDSNDSITQTGGVVIVKGPGNASGNSFGAAAVDSDGAVTLSGGTIIVFGGFEKTPSTTLTNTLCSSSNVSIGEHTVSFNDASYTTTLKSSTRGCIVYSALGSATLN